LNDCTADRQNQTSNRCLKLTARWLSHIQYIKYTKMYLLYRMYGPHTTKFVVYASIVIALHEIIDLKHRSPCFRLYPLTMVCRLKCIRSPMQGYLLWKGIQASTYIFVNDLVTAFTCSYTALCNIATAFKFLTFCCASNTFALCFFLHDCHAC